MKIRITKGVAGENRTDWWPGDVVECSEYLARQLIARGRAVPFVEEAEQQPQSAIVPDIETDSAGLGATVRGLFRRSPSIERMA